MFIVAVARLTRLENGGPPHAFVMLPGQEPATLYLPGPGYPFYTLFPKPEAQRPPAVVLIHGFTGDRVLMSGLARRLAENGYAVLAIDVNGHGENRNPFSGGAAASDSLRANVKTAVDYLRDNQLADGSRIVVMGHSMGAGAALDYATHDPSIKGAVMISGGWELGPERPKDALFIFAERDPKEPIQDTSTALAAHLAGVAQIDLGKTYGDFTQGNAVEAIRMPGLDHITIVNSPAAATVIVKWLDSTFGTARTAPIELKDARRGSARFALLIFVILLVPLGRVCGAMAPGGAEDRPGPGAWMGLLILGGALIAAMPLTAANPAAFVPIVVGSIQISWFMVAGLIIVGVIALSYPLDWYRIREGVGAAMIAGAVGFAVVYVCQVAMSRDVASSVVVARAADGDGDGDGADVPVLDGLRVAGAARRDGDFDGVGLARPYPDPGFDGGGREPERAAVRADVDPADPGDCLRDDRNILGVGVQHVAQSHADRSIRNAMVRVDDRGGEPDHFYVLDFGQSAERFWRAKTAHSC